MTVERWQLAVDAARKYEANLVPALMAPWAPQLLDAVDVGAGQRVLDIACGTGVVSRVAAERVGPDGSVWGLDLNPGMLAVATELAPDITWVEGDAMALPFGDVTFDRVVCQFGFMFFTDRPQALREMRRVLVDGGRAGVATWGAIEISPPYVALAEVLGKQAGADLASRARAPFVLPDPDVIAQLMTDAGFSDVDARQIPGKITYPDVAAFLEGEIEGTPLGSGLRELGEDVHSGVVDTMRAYLATQFGNGPVEFAAAANIVTGTA